MQTTTYSLETMIETEHCNYKTSMLLKRLGYNEWCRTFYQEAVRHNGKDLSFDEELDLRNQGRSNEIKRIRGGWINESNNKNTDDWLGKHCCSRPTLSQATRWLREVKQWHIEAYPDTAKKWHVWIVSLAELNPEDGKLNACDLEGQTFLSYEKAISYAMEFLLKCMVGAYKKILKNNGI